MLEQKIIRDLQQKEIDDALDALGGDVTIEDYTCKCIGMVKEWDAEFRRVLDDVYSIKSSLFVGEENYSVYGSLAEIVPTDQSSWNKLCGAEHRHGTLWFKRSYRPSRGSNGRRWYALDFKARSVYPLIRSAVYNALLMEHVMFGRGRDDRVCRGAVSRAVAHKIRKWSELHSAVELGDLSRDYLNLIAERFGTIAESLYIAYRLRYDARIEAHMGIIEDAFNATRGRGSVNAELRELTTQNLLNMGFADCRTRSEQEGMIALLCRNMMFRDDVAISIRRRLSKAVLDGVVALIPYTAEELAERAANGVNGERAEKARKRYEDMTERVARGERLNDNERSWFCKARRKYGH